MMTLIQTGPLATLVIYNSFGEIQCLAHSRPRQQVTYREWGEHLQKFPFLEWSWWRKRVDASRG